MEGGCREDGLERLLRKRNVLEPADMKANVATSTDPPLGLLDHSRARIDRVNGQLAGCK